MKFFSHLNTSSCTLLVTETFGGFCCSPQGMVAPKICVAEATAIESVLEILISTCTFFCCSQAGIKYSSSVLILGDFFTGAESRAWCFCRDLRY